MPDCDKNCIFVQGINYEIDDTKPGTYWTLLVLGIYNGTTKESDEGIQSMKCCSNVYHIGL